MSIIREEYMRVMAKHLPPSASTLQLLDIGAIAEPVLSTVRPDVEIQVASLDVAHWAYEVDQFDAVMAYDMFPGRAVLHEILRVLRPGGRYIHVNPLWEVDSQHVQRLEHFGYVRILVEPALASSGVLMRGEKVHTTADTLQRVQTVATQDSDSLTLADFKGRYVHLLVRQFPNKPAWKLQPDEQTTWQAVAVQRAGQSHLLAFSSLPKSVAFMQPAVMNNFVQDVNKVGKFSRETAQSWTQPMLLNPTLEQVQADPVVWIEMNPDTAEASDE